MDFEVLFHAFRANGWRRGAAGAALPAHLRIKAGFGQRGGDVFGGDHGAVAHPGAALGQVDVGLVDAGQVVQHEHHGVGGVLVGEAGDVEGGLGHGAIIAARR